MSEVIVSIPQQITVALDGRSQRWLALRIMMPETDFSKKMNGISEFSKDEIKSINTILKSKIK